MGGVSPETCWASYKYEIKFRYTVAPCWISYVILATFCLPNIFSLECMIVPFIQYGQLTVTSSIYLNWEIRIIVKFLHFLVIYILLPTAPLLLQEQTPFLRFSPNSNSEQSLPLVWIWTACLEWWLIYGLDIWGIMFHSKIKNVWIYNAMAFTCLLWQDLKDTKFILWENRAPEV